MQVHVLHARQILQKIAEFHQIPWKIVFLIFFCTASRVDHVTREMKTLLLHCATSVTSTGKKENVRWYVVGWGRGRLTQEPEHPAFVQGCKKKPVGV